METTTTKRTAKNHTPSRGRDRRGLGPGRIPAHVLNPGPDHAQYRDLHVPNRDPVRGHNPDHGHDRVPPRRDTRHRTTMTRAVRASRKRPDTDRERPPSRPAKRSPSTTPPAPGQLRQNLRQSTRKATRNTSAGVMSETTATSMEVNEIVLRRTTGIEIGNGTGITTGNGIAIRVAMIGTTTVAKTIAVATVTEISGTSTVVAVAAGTATTIDIDLLSTEETGTGIGTADDNHRNGLLLYQFYRLRNAILDVFSYVLKKVAVSFGYDRWVM